MEGEAGDWAYPFLGELTNPRNHNAAIQDLQTFGEEFARAVSDPDEERVAARKIVDLTQDDVETKSTNKYTTKFKTLAAELTWNDAALMAQFSKGLHWKTKEILSQCKQQPSTLQTLMNTAIVIDNVRQENEASRKKETGKEKEKGKGKTSGIASGETIIETTTTQVSKEEIDRHKEWGLCIKCGRGPHKATECCTGWDATPAKNPADRKKEPKKESAKIAEEEEENKDEELGKEDRCA
ncbi:Transposon Tf2-1 polyprotein, partial [Rhizoctonia solani AG-3 Rhs1AP]